MKVWKYPIPFGVSMIDMLVGAKILSVGLDPNPGASSCCCWVLVDPQQGETCPVPMYVVGTGHLLPVDGPRLAVLRFLGTVEDGPFRWHVFTDTQNAGVPL